MEATDVLDILAVLHEDGVPVVVEGGWGVDALLGAQHRDHEDLDLVVTEEHLEPAVAALAGVGFAVDHDRRPAGAKLVDREGRQVDLLVLGTEVDGVRWPVASVPGGPERRYSDTSTTTGWVAGEVVTCIDAQLQVAHHQGYEPAPRDLFDLRLLQKQFGVSLPEGYW